MLHTFREKSLLFPLDALDAWCGGDKSLLPPSAERIPMHMSQQGYHFSEAFTLRYYHETGGWKGFDHLVLMPHVEPTLHLAKRRLIERVVPAIPLRKFRAARLKTVDGERGGGEPDLFLYKDSGEFMFVETKRDDPIKTSQLVCLAQLHHFLGCPVEIVRLQLDAKKPRAPKTYVVELDDDGALKTTSP